MARLHLHPTVPDQVRTIGRWWRTHSGRPGLFAQEWKHARHRLKLSPLIGPPDRDDPDAHCLLLPRSKYHVYYRYDPPPLDEVVIVLVWSPLRGERPPLPR